MQSLLFMLYRGGLSGGSTIKSESPYLLRYRATKDTAQEKVNARSKWTTCCARQLAVAWQSYSWEMISL